MDDELAQDWDGLLYEPRLREAIGTAVTGDQLVAYEALLALRRAAFVLDRHTRGLRNLIIQDDPGMRVLIRLHGETAGVSIEDLVTDRGQEVLAVLDELERARMVIRSSGPPPSVRLSRLGTDRLDEALRRLAANVTTLVEGVPLGQLAVMRHVGLQLIVNHEHLSAHDR